MKKKRNSEDIDILLAVSLLLREIFFYLFLQLNIIVFLCILLA